MVFGAHFVFYSKDAEADRRFLAELLGLGSVDAGGGWLVFALPPAEVAVHPGEEVGADLYLMCDDLKSEMESLTSRGAHCSPVEEARWGSVTKISMPGGGVIGLYQPRHPLAIQRPDEDDAIAEWENEGGAIESGPQEGGRFSEEDEGDQGRAD